MTQAHAFPDSSGRLAATARLAVVNGDFFPRGAP